MIHRSSPVFVYRTKDKINANICRSIFFYVLNRNNRLAKLYFLVEKTKYFAEKDLYKWLILVYIDKIGMIF